jgi:hypothetical protein
LAFGLFTVADDRKFEELFAAEEIVDAYAQDLDRKLESLGF